jgi:hypothetical protein
MKYPPLRYRQCLPYYGRSHHEMTLDHKAAYLNADLWNLRVAKLLPIHVAVMILDMDSTDDQYLRKHGKPLPLSSSFLLLRPFIPSFLVSFLPSSPFSFLDSLLPNLFTYFLSLLSTSLTYSPLSSAPPFNYIFSRPFSLSRDQI